MKIVAANVKSVSLGKYQATVVVLDEGVRYPGESFVRDSPEDALQSALTRASGARLEELSNALSVRVEVLIGKQGGTLE